MEKLRFSNGYELNLMVMGIASTDEVLTLRCEPDGTLTEMETALIDAASGSAVLLSDGGEELRTYHGYSVFFSITKTLSPDGAMVQIELRRPNRIDELSRKVDMLTECLLEITEDVYQ